MANDYATIEELKAEIQQPHSADDASLQRILDAAAQAIDRFCNRPDGFVADSEATAREYAGLGLPWQPIDECTAIVLVEVKPSLADDDYEAWATTDWIAFAGDPQFPDFNPLSHGLPYDMLMVTATGSHGHFTAGRHTGYNSIPGSASRAHAVPTVRVTARWGFSTTVPPIIKTATIFQAARWYMRLKSGGADTVASTDAGQLIYRQRIDPDIAMMLIESRLVRPGL